MSVENTIISKLSNISSYYPTAETVSTSVCCQPLTVNSSTVTICNPWEEKIKKYCDATDEHVDKLEEDIDFLDKKREDVNDKLIFLFDKIGELEREITILKGENTQLRDDLNTLCSQIFTLQQKLDNQ
jgi:predicted  nucleic acid-binding Zn-ribbon protein